MAGTQDFMAYLRSKKEERGSLNDGRERFSRDGDANWAQTRAMPFITPMAPPRKGKLLTRSMVHPIGNPYEEDGIKRMAEMGMDVMGYKPPSAIGPMGSGMRRGGNIWEGCFLDTCGVRNPREPCRSLAKIRCSGGKKVTSRPRPDNMGGAKCGCSGGRKSRGGINLDLNPVLPHPGIDLNPGIGYPIPPPIDLNPGYGHIGPPIMLGGRRTKKVTPRPRPDYEAPEFNAPIGGRRVVGGRKKSTPWIERCKDYAAKNGVSFKQAMSDLKGS